MKVKICGITNKEDAVFSSHAGADALGFIFHSGSKRFVSSGIAAEIISALPSYVQSMGVFVDQSASEINRIAALTGLDIVQVYNYDPIFLKELKVPFVRAYRISAGFDFGVIDQSDDSEILLDSFSASYFGGAGEVFDWTLIPYELKERIILAGGVSSENIEYIWNTIQPAGVDLSSSVESAPGKKDIRKLEIFFDKLKRMRNKC